MREIRLTENEMAGLYVLIEYMNEHSYIMEGIYNEWDITAEEDCLDKLIDIYNKSLDKE